MNALYMTPEKRNRTINWEMRIDELAQQLAIERGYFPEKVNGGVSKFLADLVAAEYSSPRLPHLKKAAGYKADISAAQAMHDTLLQKASETVGKAFGKKKKT